MHTNTLLVRILYEFTVIEDPKIEIYMKIVYRFFIVAIVENTIEYVFVHVRVFATAQINIFVSFTVKGNLVSFMR